MVPRARDALLGEPPVRHDGRVYALHHVAEVRAGTHYDANAALMERYRAAAGDPAAMAQLVAERARGQHARRRSPGPGGAA